MSKLIIGSRGSGKSTMLVQESAKTGKYILVSSYRHALYLSNLAEQLGLKIPAPITAHDFFKTDKLVGTDVAQKGLLIDEIGEIFETIFRNIDIGTVTLSEEHCPNDVGYIMYKNISLKDIIAK